VNTASELSILVEKVLLDEPELKQQTENLLSFTSRFQPSVQGPIL
jgi:hypothetical protein